MSDNQWLLGAFSIVPQAQFSEATRTSEEAAAAAHAAAAAERTRAAIETRLLVEELAEREADAATLDERLIHAHVEARIASHTHAGQLEAIGEHTSALVTRVEELSTAAEGAYHDQRVAERIFVSELNAVEAAGQLYALKKWWAADSAPAGAGLATGKPPSGHPLENDVARREHLGALRSVLGSRGDSEIATSAILAAEIRELEDELRNAREAPPVVSMASVSEADAKLLTLDARPVDFKQKRHHRKQHAHMHADVSPISPRGAHMHADAPLTPPLAGDSPPTRGVGGRRMRDGDEAAVELTSLEELLGQAHTQLTRQAIAERATAAAAAAPSAEQLLATGHTAAEQVAAAAGEAAAAAKEAAATATRRLATVEAALEVEQAAKAAAMTRIAALEAAASAASQTEVFEQSAQTSPQRSGEDGGGRPAELTSLEELLGQAHTQLTRQAIAERTPAAAAVAAAAPPAVLAAQSQAASGAPVAAAAEAVALPADEQSAAPWASNARAQLAAMAATTEAALHSEVERLRAKCTALEGETRTLSEQLLSARDASMMVQAELAADRELSLGYREKLDSIGIELERTRAEATAAKQRQVELRAEADAEAAARAAEQRAFAARAAEQATLVTRIERQLLEQMERSAAAQKALLAAEEIQRRLDIAAADAGGGPLTLVFMPDGE